MRDTDYALEIATVSDHYGQTIERIFVNSYERKEIRFSWWPNNNLAMRPLDLPESELLPLLEKAIDKGGFSKNFLKQLHAMLITRLGD